MVAPLPTRSLPKTLRLAAALFVLYGVAIALNALTVQRAAGWAHPLEVLRAILRLTGAVIIGWGLLRQARWAWWLGLVLAMFWLITGGLSVLVFERGDVYWLAPSGFQVMLVASLVCLGGAVASLLSPSVRSVFRRSRDAGPRPPDEGA
jgi:hypothetical protein